MIQKFYINKILEYDKSTENQKSIKHICKKTNVAPLNLIHRLMFSSPFTSLTAANLQQFQRLTNWYFHSIL